MKMLFKTLVILVVMVLLFTITLNLIVIISSSGSIKTQKDAFNEASQTPFDAIVVLGCGVRPDGSPSHMLRDRLDRTLDLYNGGVCGTVLITGDHSDNYSEVTVMKNYLIEHGIPLDDIKIDSYGYSTLESMQNVADTFGLKRIVVVTQGYHMYRSLYIAGRLGITAIGVNAKSVRYTGQVMRDVREIGARVKDFCETLFK